MSFIGGTRRVRTWAQICARLHTHQRRGFGLNSWPSPQSHGHTEPGEGQTPEPEEDGNQTWLRLVIHARRLDRDTRLGAWLFTVARHLHASYCRSRLLEDSHTVGLIGLWPYGRPAPSPFEEVEASETRRRSAAVFAALPLGYREALLLIAVEGLRHAEAAEICGVTPEAMRQRVSRARALFARRLAGTDARGLTSLNERTT